MPVNGTVPVPFCKSEVKIFDVASHARKEEGFILVDQLDSVLPFLRIMLTDAMDDDDQMSSTTAEMPAGSLLRHIRESLEVNFLCIWIAKNVSVL